MHEKQPTVCVRVRGDLACFTRPEMKAERVSYDVMTPSAARGLLEAIYWKPQMRWEIRRIGVQAPIRFTNVRRNELKEKGPSAKTVLRIAEGRTSSILAQEIESERQLRASTLLRSVDYLIEAGIVLMDESEPFQKHKAMFERRVEKGQHFHQPYLGCREFAADVAPASWEDFRCPSELEGRHNLGWMLLDIDFADENRPRFFRAELIDGVLDVPKLWDREVRG